MEQSTTKYARSLANSTRDFENGSVIVRRDAAYFKLRLNFDDKNNVFKDTNTTETNIDSNI